MALLLRDVYVALPRDCFKIVYGYSPDVYLEQKWREGWRTIEDVENYWMAHFYSMVRDCAFHWTLAAKITNEFGVGWREGGGDNKAWLFIRTDPDPLGVGVKISYRYEDVVAPLVQTYNGEQIMDGESRDFPTMIQPFRRKALYRRPTKPNLIWVGPRPAPAAMVAQYKPLELVRDRGGGLREPWALGPADWW